MRKETRKGASAARRKQGRACLAGFACFTLAAAFCAAQTAAPIPPGTPQAGAGAPDTRPGGSQPVLFVLFSRFENHIDVSLEEQRLFTLFEMGRKIRAEFPGQPFKIVCEFSGTVAEKLTDTNRYTGWIDKIKQAQKEGWIEIGYSGRHEPTYRNHPRPVLRDDMKPEQRWVARFDPARKILTEHKDLLTGELDSSRTGGYARVREVFGDAVYAAHPEEQLGGEAPYVHQMRQMGEVPILSGFPDPHFFLDLHGYAVRRAEVATQLAPLPNSSPELFWDGNVLRLSFSSLRDMHMIRTADGPEALEKFLKELDRRRTRIVQMEIVDEERYLNLWPDGTPRLHPLVWAYDHPDQPNIPGGIRAYVGPEVVAKTFDKDHALLRWLMGTYIPANKGSRLLGMGELRRMAATPLGADLDPATVKAAAQALLDGYGRSGTSAPGFVRAGNHYLTAADLFFLLSESLAQRAAAGKDPAALRLAHVYAPLWIDRDDHFVDGLKVPGSEVLKVAAAIAPALKSTAWAAVPTNAIPSTVAIAGKTISPTQFLRLMAREYLSAEGNESLPVEYQNGFLFPGFLSPRHVLDADAAGMWELRPAPLHLD